MSTSIYNHISGRVPLRFGRSLPNRKTVATSVASFIGTCDPMGSIDKLAASSPVPIPDDPTEQFRVLAQRMLDPELNYNLTGTNPNTGRPGYPGVTLPGREFVETDVIEELISGFDGGLVRMNPVLEVGSGYGGAYCDRDILPEHHRYVVVESDVLTEESQAAVALGLISSGMAVDAVVHSGGKSLHMLVRVDGENPRDYREKVDKLFRRLLLLGADPSTTNPSRLTRAPGFLRARKDGSTSIQRLLFLR